MLDRDGFIRAYEDKHIKFDTETARKILVYIEEDGSAQQLEMMNTITVSDLENFKVKVRNNLGETHKDMADFIVDIVDNIIRDCQEYYEAVMRMERHSMNASSMFIDDDEYKYKITSADQHRRLVHDGLISDLKILMRIIYGPENKISGLPPLSELGMTFPSDKAFFQSRLEDRDLVGRWGILIAVNARLDALKKEAEEFLKKNKK
jgi:hypothetical protein